MYHFKKKIKCLNCDGYFRGINERGTKRYYCSTYHNRRTCIRWTINENWLIELVQNHHQISLMKDMKIVGKGKWTDNTDIALEDLLIKVEGVEVDPIHKEVTIRFLDGTKTFISEYRQAYWTNET